MTFVFEVYLAVLIFILKNMKNKFKELQIIYLLVFILMLLYLFSRNMSIWTFFISNIIVLSLLWHFWMKYKIKKEKAEKNKL